jgi:hypothetical protein
VHNPSSGVIFSLDPGHNAGWARWHDGRLVACGLAMLIMSRSLIHSLESTRQEYYEANRFAEVRAIEYYGGEIEIVKLGREHNNANVLSLGARFITDEEAQEAVKVFIETEFSGDERHVERLSKFS